MTDDTFKEIMDQVREAAELSDGRRMAIKPSKPIAQGAELRPRP